MNQFKIVRLNLVIKTTLISVEVHFWCMRFILILIMKKPIIVITLIADCKDAAVVELVKEYRLCVESVAPEEKVIREIRKKVNGDVKKCMKGVKEEIFHLGREYPIKTLRMFYKCIDDKHKNKDTFKDC